MLDIFIIFEKKNCMKTESVQLYPESYSCIFLWIDLNKYIDKIMSVFEALVWIYCL